MKKIQLLLLFSLLCASVFAQSRYAVYKISGNVQMKTSEGWGKVERRTAVTAADVFRLAADSQVGIIDNTTNRIYYSDKPGEQRVAAIINAAKRQADEITGRMNDQIRKSAEANASGGSSYASVGASHRGQSRKGATESIYALLRGAIESDAPSSSSSSSSCDSRITLRKIGGGSGDFYFEISSKCDYPLYVNVFSLSGIGKTPMLCFNLGYSLDEPYMLVPPHGNIAAKHFMFAESADAEVKYVLFGSEEPFDSQELQMLFNKDLPPTIAPEQMPSLLLYEL